MTEARPHVYLTYYRLGKPPFNLSPDPDFLWLGAQYAAALDTLAEGILNREGCVLLTGDVGTGKTILIRRLVRSDEVAPIFVTIHDPSLSPRDFWNSLAAESGLNRSFDRREAFYAGFESFLQERFAAQQKVLVLIDEAQRLNPQILQEAVGLCDLQADGRRRLKVIFVGQIELDQNLMKEENRGVLRYINARCRLEPLVEEETRRYVNHRLSVAGRQTRLFSDDALRAVHDLTKGFPRLINILCDHALLHGYSANLEEIDAPLVRECSRDLEMSPANEAPPQTDGTEPAPRETGESLPPAPAAAAGGRSRSPLSQIAAVWRRLRQPFS